MKVIKNIDTNLLSILEFDDYAEKYNYSKTDYYYFQNDGHSFENGMRLLYDGVSMRELIKVSLPYKIMNVYVDHHKRNTDKPASNDDKWMMRWVVPLVAVGLIKQMHHSKK